ncbi:MAG: class II glutamine amidotransferase, partial [Chloroflexota bacterium]|nr:class II glutamine amidotransferase [Chloroflexota bacterium]
MCGIFGYVGCAETKVDVPGMTLAALKRLEYRGYDSWGIAVRNGVGLEVEKHVGKIGLAETTLPKSTIGFGHTRWATHGSVTEPNAHPHQDESRRVALIHNGIVENYIMLKAGLIARGHTFRSDTDTEVIVHLVEEALAHRENPESDLTWAVRYAFRQLAGLNAVIVMHVDRQELVAVKNVSPLIVGISDEATYIASDVVALLEYTDRVVYLDDRQVATMTPGTIVLSNLADGTPLDVREERVTWRPDDAGIGEYPDFMSKEMAEQPAIIARLADDHAALAQDLA